MKLKKLLVTSLVAGLFALSACGQQAGTQTNSEKKEINKTELIAKIDKAGKEYKSAEVKTKNTITVIESGKTNKIDMAMDIKVVVEPLQAHLVLDATSDQEGQSIKMTSYVKDGFTYTNAPIVEQLKDVWIKTTYDENQFKSLIEQTNNNDYASFFNKVEKDLVVSESGDNYELKYEKEGANMGDIASLFTGVGINEENLGANALENTNVEKISLTYLVDKATSQAKSMTMEIKLSQKANAENKMEVKTEATYGGFNTITEIKVPEDVVKNAISQ